MTAVLLNFMVLCKMGETSKANLYSTVNFITRLKAELTATVVLYIAFDFMVYLWLTKLSNKNNRQSWKSMYYRNHLCSLTAGLRQHSCIIVIKYYIAFTILYLDLQIKRPYQRNWMQ
jgi:hypothetical protein